MKTYFLKSVFILSVLLAVTSCKDKSKEAEMSEAQETMTAEAEAVKYNVDTEASVIKWTGSKPTGSHFGTVKIENGSLMVKDGKISEGVFLIDMTSISSDDLKEDAEKKSSLEAHLKGTVKGKEGDFFNVEKYPNAAFEITEVKTLDNGQQMLSGNLTIKDVKNNISFPVTTSATENAFTIESETFSIDRTKWNVNYGSKTMFDNLGDKFINDNIELKISLKAVK